MAWPCLPSWRPASLTLNNEETSEIWSTFYMIFNWDIYIYIQHILTTYVWRYNIWLQVKIRGPDQPPKPTGDPDLTIQTCDPDLWSRPLCVRLVGHFLFQSTGKYYSVLQSATPVLLCTSLYYKVLLCTTKCDSGWSREFWKDLAIPCQTSFQTVPDQFHGIQGQFPFAAILPKKEEKTGLCVQCRII